MINEINLRTNKSEYNPGEDIFGVVYVRIISPTRGRGVYLSFHGYEKVLYEYKKEISNKECVGYRDNRDYISCNEVLHESEEPLAYCSTLYPFRIHLPTEIPGTFHACGDTADVRWEAVVEYVLKVYIIDAANTLKVRQIISVRQHPPVIFLHSGPPSAVHVAHPIRRMLFTQNVHVTARLHDHIYRSGESLKLRVIITNNSRVHVQSLKIKLLRSITLVCKKTELHTAFHDPNVTGTNEKWSICVENWCSVIREQEINMTHLQSGLDCLLIPLKNDEGSPIYPSVSGKHVNCEYKIIVVLYLSNGDTIELEVPVSVIIHNKNSQWSQWQCPVWISDEETKIHHSDSILGVPENLLFSEAFSTIPGFQPL